ncbi:hypothetical protein M422DRAFT_220266 [Sphaerobolus stellatus SS14]|nr:hypothetical protein M422DRAFT_220266 [Sphaerobolus stellatus SS14]
MLSYVSSLVTHLFTSPPDARTLQGRYKIAEDTKRRIPSIIASTPGASSLSMFYDEESCPTLPPLDKPPYPASEVEVVNSDSFTAAQAILRNDPQTNVAVLNLASDEYPAGGWDFTLSRTQEEALCYSSTLYSTLTSSYYPWPNLGPGSIAGIYSPAIVVFKDNLDHNCVDLPVSDRVVVGVMTVAAPRRPELTPDGLSFVNESDIHDLQGKIRLVFRMAGKDGKDSLVLGAMGCGAYRCPPKFVAEGMKKIILEDEFKGRFKKIVFAVYSSENNGPSNFTVFKEAYEGFVINH